MPECAGCAALCCRLSSIVLDPDEAEDRALLDDPGAWQPEGEHRILRRTADGCVFLGVAGRCTIYERRPSACRRFTCQEGWAALVLVETMLAAGLEPDPSPPLEYLRRHPESIPVGMHPVPGCDED